MTASNLLIIILGNILITSLTVKIVLLVLKDSEKVKKNNILNLIYILINKVRNPIIELVNKCKKDLTVNEEDNNILFQEQIKEFSIASSNR